MTDVSRLEAEHGPWDQGYPKVVYTGWGASGDQFVALNWNGGTDYLFYAPVAGWHRLAPRLAGGYCHGAYVLAALFIDATLLGYREVPAGWQYPQSDWIWLNPGYHTYAVGLANDYADGTCDRNLYHDYSVIHRY